MSGDNKLELHRSSNATNDLETKFVAKHCYSEFNHK